MAKLRTSESAVALMRASQLIAESNPTAFDSLSHGDHSNASRNLWASDALPSGFEYAKDQLIIAAAIIAAELAVSRKNDE